MAYRSAKYVLAGSTSNQETALDYKHHVVDSENLSIVHCFAHLYHGSFMFSVLRRPFLMIIDME